MDDPKCFCGSPIEDTIHFHLECQLYYNQRISLLNELINMNIETLLFGNDSYTDQTNSKLFEKVCFFGVVFFGGFVCLFVFLFNRQKKCVLQVSSFRVLLYSVFSDFSPVCINSWLFRLPPISNTMLYLFCCHYILCVLYM